MTQKQRMIIAVISPEELKIDRIENRSLNWAER